MLTFVGTALAMISVVFAALFSARFANVGADSANVLTVLGATAHVCRGRPTNLGAISVESNALDHLVDVTLT